MLRMPQFKLWLFSQQTVCDAFVKVLLNCQGCMAFNYNKGTQQCDMIDSTGDSESANAFYMTGLQMCGIMTGLPFACTEKK